MAKVATDFGWGSATAAINGGGITHQIPAQQTPQYIRSLGVTVINNSIAGLMGAGLISLAILAVQGAGFLSQAQVDALLTSPSDLVINGPSFRARLLYGTYVFIPVPLVHHFGDSPNGPLFVQPGEGIQVVTSRGINSAAGADISTVVQVNLDGFVALEGFKPLFGPDPRFRAGR